MIPTFNYIKIDGKLKPDLKQTQLRQEYIDSFPDGTLLEMTLKKSRTQRSSDQNRYYYGVIVSMIARETGQDKDTVNRMLEGMFLSKIVEIKGEAFKVVGKHKNLKTNKAEEYYQLCREWANDFLGLIIPLPNEVDLDNLLTYNV